MSFFLLQADVSMCARVSFLLFSYQGHSTGKASLLAYVMGQCMRWDMETNMGDLGLGWVAYQGITFAMIPPLHTYSLVLVHEAFTFACGRCEGGGDRTIRYSHIHAGT